MSQDLDVRIAKVKGWTIASNKNSKSIGGYFWSNGLDCGSPRESSEWFFNKELAYNHLPPWSSSLDLMHELEGELSEEEWLYYGYALREQSDKAPADWTRSKATYHIKAEQKAEAWLKVKERG